MIHKIIGATSSGRAQCGHRVHAGESYFIIRFGKELHAKCQQCIGKIKLFRTIRIPKDLVKGLIPLQ